MKLAVLAIPAFALTLLPVRPTVDIARAENARIRSHLATVESELRATDVSALTPPQRQARLRNLDVLHQYWVHGVFPANTDFPGHFVPYFVDRYGTRCAMAYLIEQSGHADLVARIAATHNNAYVRDLKGDPELVTWLRDNGLTAAEAARIQPTYRSPVEDFVGRWEGKIHLGPRDSATIPYVLTSHPSDEPGGINYEPPPVWMLAFAHGDPVTLRVVAFGGDSLVTQAESLAGVVALGSGPTSLRTVLHYGGSLLTGTIEISYGSGAVVRGQTEATLDCPGPSAPRDVVAFVHRANLSKVRCVTAVGVVLEHQGTLFHVTYRLGHTSGECATRIALRWHGRVGWILDVDAPPESPSSVVFHAGPTDSVLVARASLQEMTAAGLRLQWASTLLSHAEVPAFVTRGLIAALKDTVDEGLAGLLVAAPPLTRDPELLAAMAHLPVAPDSAHRNPDGSVGYITASTGYAHARDAADLLLWKQAPALIAAAKTPHDVLLTLATWGDRHRYMCGADDSEVFAALRARATRDQDTTVLSALEHRQGVCR